MDAHWLALSQSDIGEVEAGLVQAVLRRRHLFVRTLKDSSVNVGAGAAIYL